MHQGNGRSVDVDEDVIGEQWCVPAHVALGPRGSQHCQRASALLCPCRRLDPACFGRAIFGRGTRPDVLVGTCSKLAIVAAVAQVAEFVPEVRRRAAQAR